MVSQPPGTMTGHTSYTPLAGGSTSTRAGWLVAPRRNFAPEPPLRLAWAVCAGTCMHGPEGAPVQQCTGATRRIAWLQGAVQDEADEKQARGMLAAFRGELYRCFTKRPDALFELADA